MSKYTTELRFICEQSAGLNESVGYRGIGEVINKAIPEVFDFDFPIFDEAYRNVLCGKILKHYYTREICEETVGLWKLRLDTRMNEIMPYYNQLYKSELLEFNPLYDVDVKRSGTRDNLASGGEKLDTTRTGSGTSETVGSGKTTNSSNSTETANGNSKTDNTSTVNYNNTNTTDTTFVRDSNNTTTTTSDEKDLFSDTPQGALTGVETGTYLTNARKKTGDGTTTDRGGYTDTNDGTVTDVSETTTTGGVDVETNSTVGVTASGENNTENNSTNEYTNTDKFTSEQTKNAESTEEYLEIVSGKQGGVTYSQMLNEYRKTFLNIDMQVIESLSDLFFGLW